MSSRLEITQVTQARNLISNIVDDSLALADMLDGINNDEGENDSAGSATDTSSGATTDLEGHRGLLVSSIVRAPRRGSMSSPGHFGPRRREEDLTRLSDRQFRIYHNLIDASLRRGTGNTDGSQPDGDECVVCKESIEHRQWTINHTRCAMQAHAACVIRWLENNNNCPYCQQAMHRREWLDGHLWDTRSSGNSSRRQIEQERLPSASETSTRRSSQASSAQSCYLHASRSISRNRSRSDSWCSRCEAEADVSLERGLLKEQLELQTELEDTHDIVRREEMATAQARRARRWLQVAESQSRLARERGSDREAMLREYSHGHSYV